MKELQAQACCSAGTPLLSSLDIGATQGKTWQFSLTYDYNFLDDVLSGSEEIGGHRRRVSQSFLLETSYGINHRWALTAILSFIRQQRRLNTQNSAGSRQELTTRGPGDAVVLLKYNVKPLNILSQRQIAVGLGMKMPTGKSDLEWNGVLLPADMQPGTGAWDGILWGYFYQGFLPVSRINLFANASYRFTGKNNRFQLENSRFKGYKFGNVLMISGGISYRTDTLFDFSMMLRYRNVQADEFAGSIVANTGGHWFYLLPGLNINPEPVSLRLSGQLPLYRHLDGVQLTTSYSVSLSLFYTIPIPNN